MQKTILRDGTVVSTMLTQYTVGKSEAVDWDGENVLIVGGHFSNRGAQAMTFATVDQLSRRFPEKEFYLISKHIEDMDRASEFEFEILPLDPALRARSLNLVGKLAKFWTPNLPESFQRVWEDAAFAVDINGYVLSSQCGLDDSLSYLLTLMVADRYGVPYYVLPQSIGPFDYTRMEQFLIDPLVRKYIEIPEMIFSREQYGVEALQQYTDRDIQQSPDLVLQFDEYDLDNIFTTPPDFEVPQFDEPTIGIVPNKRVLGRTDKQTFIDTYEKIGETIDDLGYQIVVLPHSTEDASLCESIHNVIDGSIRLENTYSAIELERIIGQFEFMIGSRYHSIIHAYRNAVPTIVIGWAEKYRELLDRFSQSSYHFDSRNGIDNEAIGSAIGNMASRTEEERNQIALVRDEIQRQSVFDEVSADIDNRGF